MSDSTHDVLRIEGVTKRFQGTVALKSVSFTLRNHEILAIIGENGAGKSTMMKILSGLYPSSGVEGTIWIMGKEARFQNPIDAEKAGIAMIYQELNLELDLSIAENICLGAMPLNKFGLVDWAAVRKTATDALERLGIVIDVNVIARNLSPSMQQLVSIARALSRNPSILILDEPTSVLTSTETEKLMQIITGLKDKGLSCIYISHKLDEVFQLCDRIIVFRDGCYISEHTRTNGYKSTEIIQEMIGRDLEVMYPQIEHSVGNELLRVEQLSVPHPTAYGKNIIEDVSFTLNKGEILGLAGLVGSGRSEILNAVFGGIRKNSGYLFLDGKKIDIQNPQDAKKHGIGLLTEDRKKNGIIPGLSIKHNMTITILDQLCNFLFIDGKQEDKKASEFFRKLAIKAPGLDTFIANLSGGNQQKAILSKWLMTDLKVLLLDEPTRGIDVGAKAEIYKIIGNLASMGVSIIMISSELQELIQICDRFVVLGKGRVQSVLHKHEADEVTILKAASGT